MKINKEDLVIVVFAAFCIFVLFMSYVYADDRPILPSVINNYTTEAISHYDVKGTALSNALSAIDCNMSSDKWHGGAAAGFYDGNMAPAVGICKRFGDGLIRGSIGSEDGKKGGHVGIMFNFE